MMPLTKSDVTQLAAQINAEISSVAPVRLDLTSRDAFYVLCTLQYGLKHIEVAHNQAATTRVRAIIERLARNFADAPACREQIRRGWL